MKKVGIGKSIKGLRRRKKMFETKQCINCQEIQQVLFYSLSQQLKYLLSYFFISLYLVSNSCLLLIPSYFFYFSYRCTLSQFASYIFYMSYGKSLSPAQIQYLRIGPKATGSTLMRNQLTEAIRLERNKQFAGETSVSSSLNKIPKLSYGEFEKTVSNFGVMINKNFGNETLVHQTQKFGKIAEKINQIMLQQKDKPIFNEKKNALLKKLKDRSDNRTSIKTVYEWRGQKIYITLKSFSLQSQKSNQGGLPIPYLRFLIAHVNSSRLVKIIENAIKSQGNQIVVEFDKIESRASHFSNNEVKYQKLNYDFERMGQVMTINLPEVQFYHVESNFSQRAVPLNKEILDIIESNFDNVNDLVEKYLDTKGLQEAMAGTGKNKKEGDDEEVDVEEGVFD